VAADPSRCVQCGICGYNCPVGISVRDYAREGKIVDDERCVKCGLCIEKCPRGTLRWESTDGEQPARAPTFFDSATCAGLRWRMRQESHGAMPLPADDGLLAPTSPAAVMERVNLPMQEPHRHSASIPLYEDIPVSPRPGTEAAKSPAIGQSPSLKTGRVLAQVETAAANFMRPVRDYVIGNGAAGVTAGRTATA
jgi:NAD-dependent dihydropyrimidine dehydrogenase PreA subunit